MLIVIEGLDGAGKSTQVKRLRNYLTERCGDLKYLHFPRYDAPVVGEMVSRFLRGDYGSIEKVHPQIVALLFAEDRRDASAQVRQWLDEGKMILFDRYVYSNIAYQCAKLHDSRERVDLLNWILTTEYEHFQVPRPDLNIFLDVPIDFVEKRLMENRKGEDRDYLQGKGDIHEADIQFQKEVKEVYLEMTRRDADFIRIDCADDLGRMLPPEVIFDKIREIVREKLDK